MSIQWLKSDKEILRRYYMKSQVFQYERLKRRGDRRRDGATGALHPSDHFGVMSVIDIE